LTVIARRGRQRAQQLVVGPERARDTTAARPMGSRPTRGWFVTVVPKNIGAHRGVTAVAAAVFDHGAQYIAG
jgi:hypothetical protein